MPSLVYSLFPIATLINKMHQSLINNHLLPASICAELGDGKQAIYMMALYIKGSTAVTKDVTQKAIAFYLIKIWGVNSTEYSTEYSNYAANFSSN